MNFVSGSTLVYDPRKKWKKNHPRGKGESALSEFFQAKDREYEKKRHYNS